jgi:ketosteroid isomerase-like protein
VKIVQQVYAAVAKVDIDAILKMLSYDVVWGDHLILSIQRQEPERVIKVS